MDWDNLNILYYFYVKITNCTYLHTSNNTFAISKKIVLVIPTIIHSFSLCVYKYCNVLRT